MDSIIDIGITVDPNDLKKWLRALDRVESGVQRQALEVPRQQAIDYMTMLIQNIISGKHGPYPKYNERYALWKSQFRGGASYWQLFGDLVQAIGTFRVGGTEKWQYAWLSGIPAGVDDSGGKSWMGIGDRGEAKEIAFYGGVMEGTIKTQVQNHPARPIFGPTLEEYTNKTSSGGGPVGRATQGLIRVSDRWQ